MNPQHLSLKLTLAAISTFSIFAIMTVWMAWALVETATDDAWYDRLVPTLQSASSITGTALERERAAFLRDVTQLARNGAIRQLLFDTRRRSLASPQTVTDAVILRAVKIETAVLVYDRFPLAILSTSSSPSFTPVLLDSSVLSHARRQTVLWSMLKESERLFIGGLHMTDVADSCYLVAASQIDSTLIIGKQQIDVMLQRAIEKAGETSSMSIWIPLTVGGIMLLLSLIAFWRVASTVRSGLSNLQYALKQTENHNLDYKLISGARFSEIAPLFEAYNTMVSQLATRQHRLMYLEKVSAWREIAQRMAHEIKNPLTPIQLTIEQLRDSYSGENAKFRNLLRESVEMILEEIENLRVLTKEFSEFARLPSLKFQTVNLTALISDSVKMYGSSPIETDLASDVKLEADPDALRRILVNLLENARTAIAHEPGGKIFIKLIETENEALWDVVDNGLGISQSHLSKIFNPYFGTNANGMGLGLAIVKSIIEEHRGSIEVDSVENRGTTFHIRLPKTFIINGKEAV
jgi:nitrogen fixation/metabolism regulation signal transduction histidine kinase